MNAARKSPHSPHAVLNPLACDLIARMSEERQKRVEDGETAHDTRPDRKAYADAAQRHGCRRRVGIFFEGAHDTQERNRRGHREWRVLRVDEHVAPVERARGEESKRDQAGERAAEPPSEPPRDKEANEADRGAHQPSRLEQAER